MPHTKGRPYRPPVLSVFQTDQRGTITISVSHGIITKDMISPLSAFSVKKARISPTQDEVDLKFASEHDCGLMTHRVTNHILHALAIRFKIMHPPEIRKIKAL